MPVLIDGNNLLHAAQKVGSGEHLVGRSMLCDTLGQWASRYKQRVHIVFDGPEPPAALAAQIGHAKLQVSFSGGGVSADEVVIDLVEADSAARRLLVVSSDRAIVRVAKRRKARPMKAEAFWLRVERDLARPWPAPMEPEEKRRGQSPDATDAWLDEFGLG